MTTEGEVLRRYPITPVLTADSAMTLLQAFFNFSDNRNPRASGPLFGILVLRALLVTHDNTSISLATLEHHQQAAFRLITV